MRRRIKAYLLRLDEGKKETLGNFFVYDEIRKVFECKTLELPWKQNAPFISSIHKGSYWISHRYSDKHKNHLEIENVHDRSCILIHVVNYVKDLEGCIGVGKTFADLDGDGLLDITSSRDTLNELIKVVPKEGIPLVII